MIAQTPPPPYYTVIFTSLRSDGDQGYARMSEQMLQLAKKQEGFLGVESAREELGITVSYWRNEEAIRQWKMNAEHSIAREKGRSLWYQSFHVRIAKVERDYAWSITSRPFN